MEILEAIKDIVTIIFTLLGLILSYKMYKQNKKILDQQSKKEERRSPKRYEKRQH